MPINMSASLVGSYFNYLEKHRNKFATGKFSNDNRTEEATRKIDIGIMETLYDGEEYSSLHMPKGEALALLDLMMNTPKYRESFKASDPERYVLYQAAHQEFIGDIRDDFDNPADNEKQTTEE